MIIKCIRNRKYIDSTNEWNIVFEDDIEVRISAQQAKSIITIFRLAPQPVPTISTVKSSTIKTDYK